MFFLYKKVGLPYALKLNLKWTKKHTLLKAWKKFRKPEKNSKNLWQH